MPSRNTETPRRPRTTPQDNIRHLAGYRKNVKQPNLKEKRKLNSYNVFRHENKEVLKNMSSAEISLAYQQSRASGNFPEYTPSNTPSNLQSVDSDEESIDDWMKTQKNSDVDSDVGSGVDANLEYILKTCPHKCSSV